MPGSKVNERTFTDGAVFSAAAAALWLWLCCDGHTWKCVVLFQRVDAGPSRWEPDGQTERGRDEFDPLKIHPTIMTILTMISMEERGRAAKTAMVGATARGC